MDESTGFVHDPKVIAGDARFPTPSVDVPVSENLQTEVPNVTIDGTDFEFSKWLEYSPSKDAAFCLPCFLFDKPTRNSGSHVFTKDGFRNWKKVNDGNNCSFLNHMGKEPNSFHRASEQAMIDLMNQSQDIQKVKKAIREEIGDAKFCLIVDEARDEAMKEQMAIVIRFVDKDGFVRERFFGVVYVPDTTALTLKNEIYSILSHHSLDIQDIRGQGYDGARNMRVEWNELKALVSNDFPYAYYIHCFAHRLQLALVAASKEVILRTEQLKKSYADQIAYFVEIGELETGRGLNQISTLQRAGDTRWGSHLRSISSLVNIFSPTCEILLKIIKEGNTTSQREAAYSCYHAMISFEFVFILHLMKEIMKITDALCQALQCQSQDILNAMNFVSSTKALVQKFRDEEWDNLLTTVKSFCEVRDIDVPDMNARYVERGGLARYQQDDFTIEHHYRVDIFYATIDSILQELNHRFSKHAVELLNLSLALDPKEARESFRSIDILLLVSKFYPKDFTNQEMKFLKTEVDHYEHNVVRHPDFKKL
ncbi:uncharacterized protein LOC112007517 [Quercus suber]|uniref:uncharacterized protein LOC112007517 n=1 Tax=Quercus suber TaxID=58331 RepID=UPI000CE1F1FA|nr:zinc finger MYM-type protein 1-like [Quercus suber]